jgi:hypothetical protein
MKRLLAVVLATGVTVGITTAADAASVRRIPGTACPAFPADNVWHADISALPVHARSAAWLANMTSTARLHPDFGPSYGEQSVPYGIPITVVKPSHRKVKVRFGYADESDRVRYPLGKDTKVEGGQWRTGDRHTIVVDAERCRLYETWATRRTAKGWRAGSGAVWDLRSNALRPAGWTSADAAGLPILPGLLRYDEVRAGRVDHAIRFTTDVTDRRFVWPARHQAGAVDDRNYPPMGARFRLKAGFDMTGLRGDTRTVLRAMQTHGLILADNGSPWYFQGTADHRWPEGLLDELKSVPAAAFEAVDAASLMVSPNSARAR